MQTIDGVIHVGRKPRFVPRRVWLWWVQRKLTKAFKERMQDA